VTRWTRKWRSPARGGALALALALLAGAAAGCHRRATKPAGDPAAGAGAGRGPVVATTPAGTAAHAPIPKRAAAPALAEGETYIFHGEVAEKKSIEAAQGAELLDVDLGDGWAPFIFQDGGASGDAGGDAKPNSYRKTFVDLANDRVDPDGQPPKRDEHNYLEVFGLPPALSVLAARVEEDLQPARRACFDGLDLEPLRRYTGNVGFLDRGRAQRDFAEAVHDSDWIRKQAKLEAAKLDTAAGGGAGAVDAALIKKLRDDPKRRGRVDRYLRGQARVAAVRAAQAYLACDRLLLPATRGRFSEGMFDLPTHEALADWERKNDVFGWGLLGGETLAGLLRPALALHFDTFKRVLAERVADAAGIVEDGSAVRGRRPATYRDVAGQEHPVPNLIQQHVDALLASIHVGTPEDMVAFLRSLPRTQEAPGLHNLHVAFVAPPLPPYYGPPPPPAGIAAVSAPVSASTTADSTTPPALAAAPPSPSPPLATGDPLPTLAITSAPLPPPRNYDIDLSVEIDRGDVWYDFPFDNRGRPVEQRRDHYPHLIMFARWNGQKIPLCRWRTTIGSWRSEVHPDGRIYMKYKNSDVGERVWKNIVAGPVWIPPDGTPARDLLTQRVLDRKVGAVTVVNSDVMGPGFQSAYGLVLAIHIDPKRGGFDNQIRTHGSVDYTSIARRFSHGCHRLVNNRAVRMFDFVLRHHPFRRIGDVPLHVRRRFDVDGKPYAYKLDTRGYYYELARPVPVDVSEGRIMGAVKKPITAFVRKPGVDYSAPASSDAATSIHTPPPAPPSETAGAGAPEAEPPAPLESGHELGP
jgi:hypothetical protein